MEYTANVELTYDDFLRWIKVHSKTSRRKLNIISRVFSIIATVVMTAGVVILAWLDAIDTQMIIMIAIFIICFVFLMFRDRFTAKISQKSFTKNLGTLFYTINDEGIFVKTLKTEEKYYYSGVTSVFTDGEIYYILLDKDHAMLLPKRSFTAGDPDCFALYLAERTGLEITNIKC